MGGPRADTGNGAHVATRRSVLVTGGAGFIGANLVRRLVALGADVAVLDDLSVGTRSNLRGLPVRLVEASVLDRDAVRQAVAGREWIVHLAAQTGVPASIADPWHDCTVNVSGTLNVLEAVREVYDRDGSGRLPRVLFASSNAVLGRQPPPAAEDRAPLPISPYGASKLAGEGYCLAYAGAWGVPTVVLRFANVFGPFSDQKESVVAKFMREALVAGTLTIHGDGAQTRDFIYVDDLCEAVIAALQSDLAGEVFQVATGVETSIVALVDAIEQVLGRPLERTYAAGRRGDVAKSVSQIGKAARLLGWQPRTSLLDGLQRTARWFASEPQERAVGEPHHVAAT